MHPKEYQDRLAYTIAGAVAATGISRSRLYEMMHKGELKAFKLGRRTLIGADELRGLIARLQAAA